MYIRQFNMLLVGYSYSLHIYKKGIWRVSIISYKLRIQEFHYIIPLVVSRSPPPPRLKWPLVALSSSLCCPLRASLPTPVHHQSVRPQSLPFGRNLELFNCTALCPSSSAPLVIPAISELCTAGMALAENTSDSV